MKKKLFIGLMSGVVALSLASCGSKDESDTAKITDGAGNTLEVSKTEDTQTVATVFDTLKTVDAKTSDINSAMFNVAFNENISYEEDGVAEHVIADLAAKAYVGFAEDTTSILKHDVWLEASGNVDVAMEDSTLKLENISAKAFTDNGNVYLSYKNLNLSKLGIDLPVEAKYYASSEYIAFMLNMFGVNIDEYLGYVTGIEPTFISQYIETFSSSYKNGTYDFCKDLSITITDTSSEEVEFCANTNIASLCTVVQAYFAGEEGFEEIAEEINELSNMIGSAGIAITYRINTKTLLPTKLAVSTSGLKEAFNAYIATDSELAGTTIKAMDLSASLNIAYNESKPTEDTSGYMLYGSLEE